MVGFVLKYYKLHSVISFALLIFGALITLYILFTGSNHPLAFPFILVYVAYLLLYSLVRMRPVLKKIKTLTFFQVKKLTLTFCANFLILSSLTYFLNVYIQSNDPSIYDFSIPFGVALGITVKKMNSFPVQQNGSAG